MSVSPALALKIIAVSTRILCINGQTTQRISESAASLAKSLGYSVTIIPSWDHCMIKLDALDKATDETRLNDARIEILDVSPVGVDMNKVNETLVVLDKVRAGLLPVEQGLKQLEEISALPPASLARFVLMAGLGAVALGLIFGVTDGYSLLAIFISAALGAVARKTVARYTRNLFAQPLSAALLAGLIGALLQSLKFDLSLQFIEVAPCMILVPGVHIINGSLDLARGRISLGIARLTYSSLIILMICLGLLLGLWLGGETLAPNAIGQPLPLVFDMLAASLAIAAFGTFFSMPWRLLLVPMAVGAVAHALRWGVIAISHDVVIGAAAACFFVGIVATPLAHKLKLPFAALGFASVVSMMPGVFLFRMSSGLVEIYKLGGKSTESILGYAASDAMTALMICMAITFGLITPKLVIEHFFYENKKPTR
jgi:uncharacterized membrane protein YjjP (DUF1212 family)